MKPFFGFNLTFDKKNESYDGEEFLVKKPSDNMQTLLDGSSERADAMEEKAKLPLVYRIVKGICGFFGIIFVSVLVRMFLEGEITLREAYGNAPVVFWVGIASVVIWIVLFFKGRDKLHEVVESEEFAKTKSDVEQSYATFLEEMGVPDGAVDMDVFMFFYRIKNGKLQIRSKGLQLFEFFNLSSKAWSDGEYLYFVRADGKFAFPIAAMTGIRTVRKRTIISSWNKDEAPNKGEYKQYKLALNNYGCVICRSYYVLELICEGEEYGIYFPPYELPVMEMLTGLRADAMDEEASGK